MNEVLKCFGIEGNYSSHSFRIGKVNRLLQYFPLEKVCQIIGHQHVQTTYGYARLLQTEEMENNLELVDQ